MRRLVVIAFAVALAVPASASAARVDVMVVGQERVLHAPSDVRLKVRKVKVAGRRCRVGAATPLSVLVATRLRLGLRDYGRCGRRPRDAAGLYVTRVRDEREKGRGGWVYKVGRRTPSLGAADLTKRLRDGQRVTWFWCEQDDTRRLPANARGAAGAHRRGARRGAHRHRARLRRLRPRDRDRGSDGAARLGDGGLGRRRRGRAHGAGRRAGEQRLEATRDGLVPAFPVEVTVG